MKGLAVISSRFWLRAGRSRLAYFQTKLARRRLQTPDRVAPVFFLVRFEALLDIGAAMPQGVVVKLGDLARRSEVGHLPAAGGPEDVYKRQPAIPLGLPFAPNEKCPNSRGRRAAPTRRRSAASLPAATEKL